MGDEPRARELLLAMQERLARDPYEALGVFPSSPAVDVRNAFLALTKTYHPARFGRMAVDVQKLANEVFLSLRAAHEQLSRPNASSPAKRTGPIPTTPGRTTTPPNPASATTPPPAGRPSTGPTGTHASIPGQPTRPPTGAQAPVPRPPSVPLTQPAGRSTTGPNQAIPQQPASRPQSAPLGSRPDPSQRFVPPESSITRPYGAPPSPPATTPPPTTPPARTPTGSMPAVSRTSTSPLSAPQRTPAPGPAATPRPGPRVTGSGALPTTDPELAPILELMKHGQFAASRVALETLAARSPDVARYRALIAYSRGREAQLAQRINEARVDLMEALQIDPQLELAKTALSELFTRRK